MFLLFLSRNSLAIHADKFGNKNKCISAFAKCDDVQVNTVFGNVVVRTTRSSVDSFGKPFCVYVYIFFYYLNCCRINSFV